jgi:hypothetical protein
MAEEKKQPVPKQVMTVFIGDENLPTHYVNSVNIRAGLEEFFLTFGTALPLDIVDIKDLENIDSVNAHALFRCAITRSMMKQLIDLMTSLYDNQLAQVEQLQTSQRRDEAYGNSDSKPS